MRCDSCHWNTYCSQADMDLNINGGECLHYDNIDGASEYLPTREEFYAEFYKYMEENQE